MTVFTLTIIRQRIPHDPTDQDFGETEANRQKIIQGHMDTDLSQRGCCQARLASQRLQNERYTHVFSSDLKRAHQTCELILEQNKVSVSNIVTDPRLRERNFGTFQGRPSEEFIREARKNCPRVSDYTPPEGESQGMVRERAVSFFTELCDTLRQQMVCQDTGGGTLGIQQRAASSSDVFTDCPPDAGLYDASDFAKETSHSNSGSTSSTSGYSSGGGGSLEMLPPLSPADPSPAPLSPGNGNYEEGGHVFTPLFDADIRSVIRSHQTLQHGCPNVSLSPIFEHRLSSISSVSSGRNGSFDDGDIVHPFVADVLVLSHGGFIRELLNHFTQDLGCLVMGGNKLFLQSPMNTAISKFTITLPASSADKPTLTCLMINDQDHLAGYEAISTEGF